MKNLAMNALNSCFLERGTHRQVEAHQLLLRAGEVAQHLYLIERGSARLYVLDAQGRETSTQFFFEGEVVSSLESFTTGSPSALSLITMEVCHLRVLKGDAVKAYIKKDAALQADLQALTQQRLIHYINLYTSAIADSPTQRYVKREVMPALLKGFLDKVFTKGWAYEPAKVGLKGHLTHIQRAVVVTTMNTPKWAYRLLYGDAVQRALVRGTLRKCGVRKVEWVALSPVSHATDAKRKAWLDKVAAMFAA